MLPLYASYRGTLEDLYQLRRALELGVIDVAVQNASDEHVARLVKLAQAYETAAVTNRVGRRKELGLMFHRTILEATGNGFVKDMAGVLEEYFTRAAREIAGWAKREDAVSHRQIAEAFLERDPSKAWSLMRKHLRPWKSIRSSRLD
jgi:DNA-binding FadR family transcriptional regulator